MTSQNNIVEPCQMHNKLQNNGDSDVINLTFGYQLLQNSIFLCLLWQWLLVSIIAAPTCTSIMKFAGSKFDNQFPGYSRLFILSQLVCFMQVNFDCDQIVDNYVHI